MQKQEAKEKIIDQIKKDMIVCEKNNVRIEQSVKSIVEEFKLQIEQFQQRVKQAEAEASNSKTTAAYLQGSFTSFSEETKDKISQVQDQQHDFEFTTSKKLEEATYLA